ncbi:DUF1737 domain-containing protein [Kineosporia succinea]|uniref:DUF1737 domain-containing protein n=1 Tax=Kineosporia succinea TaxID=84632 RepID=A0ABT9NXU3_9ACTN|nr:DUF1737 domain-containing protein [Kineosporia succinea]MDP9825253.1 hypothetical protein [Kineosporia succinea]
MDEVTEYKLLHSRGPDRLTEDVNEHLADGWRLHGITMSAPKPVGDGSIQNLFVQAVVR